MEETRKPFKTDNLYFRTNLSQDAIDTMKHMRVAYINISAMTEGLGESRELSLAHTHIEQALFYVIKHICLLDPEAKVESL